MNSCTIEEYKQGNVTITEKNVFDDPRSYSLGFVCGAGVIWKWLCAEVRYELSNGMSPSIMISSDESALNLMLSFIF
jgi:hypothetical protein